MACFVPTHGQEFTYENGIPEADSVEVANMIQQYIKDHTRLGILSWYPKNALMVIKGWTV